MALFGKKKEAPAATPAAAGVPTERVLELRKQGVQNNQIADMLQREGYNQTQIYDAMSQADIKSTIEVPAGSEVEVNVGQPAGGPIPYNQEQAQAYQPEAVAPAPMPAPPQGFEAPGLRREEIEEIAESIIDEKWEELMKSVEKIVAWKDETTAKIAKMEQQMKDIKERFDQLHKGVLAKVGEYDKSIKTVGADIKAMESVFKKILPTFTENVSQLSRLTNKMSPKKKKLK